MSLQGKIISLNGKMAMVEVEPRPECKGCHACTGLLGDKKSSTRQIEVKIEDVKVEIGDEVVIDLEPGHGSIAALIIFGMPMLAFFLGLYFAPTLCNAAGIQQSDLLMVISGFFCMGIAFVMIAVFSRTSSAKSLAMKIIKKL